MHTATLDTRTTGDARPATWTVDDSGDGSRAKDLENSKLVGNPPQETTDKLECVLGGERGGVENRDTNSSTPWERRGVDYHDPNISEGSV